MAVSSTPSMLELYSVFGAPNGTTLTQLVRGGAYVPNTPANSGIPTAPPLDLLDFVGATAQQVQLTGGTVTAIAISPNDATAGYQLTSGGAAQQLVNGVASTLYNWLLSGSASDFDVFATLNSGTLTSGTTGSWLNMGTTRSWTVQRTVNAAGVNSANITLQLRPAGGGATLATAVIQLNAEVDV